MMKFELQDQKANVLGLCMLGLCTKYSLWSCMVALPTATNV